MAKKNLQPTYKRQRFLLAFIRQLNDGVTLTDLQKLIFLYIMKEKSYFYEFIPYKFGPYSFQLAEDINILSRDSFLSIEDSHIQAIGEYQHKILYPITPERGNNLIRKTYREYPYYAINSEILNRLFYETEAERFRHERQNYAQADQVLFTIGYEGKNIESFMNTLIQNDVHMLCDVRKNPISRKFGFSKGKLGHISKRIGIKYIHIPDLGIDSDKRTSLDTIEDYQHLFDGYAKTLPSLKSQIEDLYSLLCSNNRIALMCYEKEPERCHRHVIRDYIDRTYGTRSENL